MPALLPPRLLGGTDRAGTACILPRAAFSVLAYSRHQAPVAAALPWHSPTRSVSPPPPPAHLPGGFMVYAATTCKYTFAMQPGDVYWCTADCG